MIWLYSKLSKIYIRKSGFATLFVYSGVNEKTVLTKGRSRYIIQERSRERGHESRKKTKKNKKVVDKLWKCGIINKLS